MGFAAICQIFLNRVLTALPNSRSQRPKPASSAR